MLKNGATNTPRRQNEAVNSMAPFIYCHSFIASILQMLAKCATQPWICVTASFGETITSSINLTP
jgi:hypothetical protein